MTLVAIDVGSGFTKFCNDEVEGEFVSLVCPVKKGEELGFGSEKAEIITIDGEKYLVGKHAYAFGAPDRHMPTRFDDYAGSVQWRALLYAALDHMGVDDGDEVTLVTGLPQALYAKRAQSLVKLLKGEHQWNNSGTKRRITVQAKVIPQAMAALFAAASKPGNEHLTDAVGEIDWGTYTTGYSWVEQEMVVDARSGGAAIGVSDVVDALGAHLKREHGIELRVVQIPAVLRSRQVTYRGEKIDVGEDIDRVAAQVAEPVFDRLRDLWGQANDAEILCAGGGAEIFLKAVKAQYPHARISDTPFRAVVNGLYEYGLAMQG